MPFAKLRSSLTLQWDAHASADLKLPPSDISDRSWASALLDPLPVGPKTGVNFMLV